VAVIGPAAAADHVQVRQPLPERGVAGAKIGWVAGVELLGLVELGMAQK
jgi:hypothetical protein